MTVAVEHSMSVVTRDELLDWARRYHTMRWCWRSEIWPDRHKKGKEDQIRLGER